MTRTANPVNEIANITESTGSTQVVPANDPAGNMTTMPQVTDRLARRRRYECGRSWRP